MSISNNMKWKCACGAKLDVTGPPRVLVGMLQNFVNLHPCSLREDSDEEEGGRESATESQAERRGEYDQGTNDRFLHETPTIIGFQPNE